MGFFRRKPRLDGGGETLGHLLVPVAAQECVTLQETWGCTFEDDDQVAVFAELAILFLSVADRLAFKKYGDPLRTEFMNPALAVVRAAFARQSFFGETSEDRGRYFNRLLLNRFQQYGNYKSIMGDNMEDNLVFNAARHLVSICLKEQPGTESYWEVVGDTSKILTMATVTLFTTPSFKTLTSS